MGKRDWIIVITLSLLSGMISGCASAPANRIGTTPVPAEAPATFNIPKVSEASINGGALAWADHAFHVDVLHCDTPARLPVDRFDAQLRLAWDDSGLLFFVEVIDDQIHETDSPIDLGTGTSVEVFAADPTGKQHWYATISPGVDAASPRMRISYWDDRAKAFRTVAPCMQTAVKSTPHGYNLEGAIPWSMSGMTPSIGTKTAFAIRLNKPESGHMAHLIWPTPWAPNSDATPRLVLANEPSAPVSAAIDGDYERLHRAWISVATTNDVSGAGITIAPKDGAALPANLVSDGRLTEGRFSLPMPALGKHYPEFEVRLGDRNVGKIKLGNADDLRGQYLNDLELVATPSVFNQRSLPEIDFSSPAAAEDMLGNYTIRTTYYDSKYDVVTSADQPGRYGAVVEVMPEAGKSFKRYLTLYRAPLEFDLRTVHLPVPLALPESFGIDPAIANEQLSANSDYIADEMRLSRRHDNELAIYLAGLSEISPGTKNLPNRLGPFGQDAEWWYGLQKHLGYLKPYRYLVHLPVEEKQKYPLILFLHGSGERGTDVNAVSQNGLPKILKNDPGWKFQNDFIVVSPQCLPRQVWNPMQLRDMLDEVSAKYPVDPDRIYVVGLSMGGFGSWEMAECFPDRFAAIAPVCGGGDPQEASRLADLPIWVFHGQVDTVVPIQTSYEMVKALREVHGRVRFTIYPDRSHNSWVPAFDDDRLYEWLLQQRRGQPAQQRSKVAGTQPAEE